MWCLFVSIPDLCPLSYFVNIFLYVVPSLQSGGIGPERSGLIKHFNVFHQSLGELSFDFSFSTNVSRSALLDFLISFVTMFLLFL